MAAVYAVRNFGRASSSIAEILRNIPDSARPGTTRHGTWLWHFYRFGIGFPWLGGWFGGKLDHQLGEVTHQPGFRHLVSRAVNCCGGVGDAGAAVDL